MTATQFVALLETTGNSGTVNFVNGGDFAVSAQTVSKVASHLLG